MAIIASGNLEVSGADPIVTQIEGVYIVDGSFEIGAADEGNDFTGEGIFIAGSFEGMESTNRDLGENNATDPAVKFHFRPDLWLNAPDVLWIPSYTWQELAP